MSAVTANKALSQLWQSFAGNNQVRNYHGQQAFFPDVISNLHQPLSVHWGAPLAGWTSPISENQAPASNPW